MQYSIFTKVFLLILHRSNELNSFVFFVFDFFVFIELFFKKNMNVIVYTRIFREFALSLTNKVHIDSTQDSTCNEWPKQGFEMSRCVVFCCRKGKFRTHLKKTNCNYIIIGHYG